MSFDYHGLELEEFHHPFNATYLNERAVELAVVAAWSSPWAHHRLEVGNVTGHYPELGIGPRTVVDLYEHAPGVVNRDVFDIGGAWDEIITISTLEHVGLWADDVDPDPTASFDALQHLRSLLAPGGRMLVTVPTGANPDLDARLAADVGAVRSLTVSRERDGWATDPEPTFRPYAATTSWAEAVWIGEFEAA